MSELDRGPSVLIVTIIFFTLATVFVALRLVSRIGIVRKLNPDDYVMLFAWVIAFGLSFSICYGTAFGLGKHQASIPASQAGVLKKTEYVFSVLYNPALMATKTSILLFYLKLGASEQIFRWFCYATLAVVNVVGFALTFLNVFQCRPVGAVFQTPVPDTASCENIITLYLSSAPVNIITDLAILFLPMPILTSMRLPRKQKIILIITFGVGFFVAVIDVIRIAYLQDAAMTRIQAQQAGISSDTAQRNDTDVSWYASLSYMWSGVEVNVGIMCGCVPMLKPLVSRFMPQLLRDLSGIPSSLKTQKHSDLKYDSMTTSGSRMGNLDELARPPKAKIEAAEASCSSNSHAGADEIEVDNTMGIMDFLTTPDMKELPPRLQKDAAHAARGSHAKHGTHDIQNNQNTHGTRGTGTTAPLEDPSPTFFDFVNMNKQKSLVDMTTRESLFPFIMVTVLFLVWGVAYGFLDTLNAQFQRVAHMTKAQSTGIHSAYFAGYFVGPLTFGRLCLIHWGFKACYIVGLCIYACGILVFWPAAVLTSFPAFLVSNFIVGLGLSTLEIAANPFIALCGPQKYMEIRLNLSQGFQGIGSVVSPLLAEKVLFKSTDDASSLIDVQWTYLGIALFSVLLAVAYFYVPLPEATNAELERAQGQRPDRANEVSLYGVRIIWISLALGVLSQWVYVGAQESLATTFAEYHDNSIISSLDVVDCAAIMHSFFTASRFVGAGLNYFVKARYLLLFFYAGAIAFAAVVMTTTGLPSTIALILLFFSEGPIFSLIFAMALRGLGRHTKDGSALLTAAISGGACWPAIVYSVTIKTGQTRNAYIVIISGYATGILLPFWQNLQPVAKKLADPMPEEDGDGAASSVRRASGRERRSSSSGGKLNFFRHRRREGSSSVGHVEEAEHFGSGGITPDLPPQLQVQPGIP